MLKKGQIALCLNDEGQLLPVDGESAERYVKLNRNKVYLFTMKVIRNYKFLQKYFSLINLVYKNQEKFTSRSWFREWTLIKVGFCEMRVDPFTNEVNFKAKSISFSKCTESEFEQVYNDSVTLFMKMFCYDDDFFNQLCRYD